MPATILSGRIAREACTATLVERVKRLGYTPKLAIIQVGDRPDSTAYINAKKSFAAKIGVDIVHRHEAEQVTQTTLTSIVQECNKDTSIQGIIIQLPLPSHIDTVSIIEAIDPHKDVDGLTTTNYQKMILHESGAIIPATARGVFELFRYYSINVSGKNVVVVGRSRLVGTPIAVLAKQAGAQVVICHSKTPDIAAETKKADIVIVAAGKPKLIGADHIKDGAIVIDIGITKMPDGTIQGDVDHATVDTKASLITPTIGGVGPMTVLGLFENVLDTCK